MPHAWESNVVGGVMAPRFVLCNSANFITNGEFEVDATGWTSGTQTADPLTPFGDYALKITAASETICDPDNGNLGGKTYLITFFARGTESSEDVDIYVSSPAETHTETMAKLSNTEYKQYAFVVTWAAGQTSSTFKVKFDPTGDLYIDRIRVYEVASDIDSMPSPAEDTYEFPQQLQARTVKIDMTITDYVLGWRFLASLKYDFMTAQHEVWRTQISEAALVVFWPHADGEFVATCLWDEKRYRRRYFHNRYLGHVGTIELIGVDLLAGKPVEIVS